MAGAGPCSWAARTTSADGGSTRPWPPRAGHCPIASARWRSPTSSAERDEVRSTCRRCRTAPPGSWRPWLSWPANCVPRGPAQPGPPAPGRRGTASPTGRPHLVGRARRGEVDLSAMPYRASRELAALAELARELRSSRATCLGRHCPSRRGCHWRLARSRAEAAHLVCVNHALLLRGPETLPPFEDVVIDEAHLLYHEATEAFSDEIDAVAIDLLLADLRGRRRQRPLWRPRPGGSGAAGLADRREAGRWRPRRS